MSNEMKGNEINVQILKADPSNKFMSRLYLEFDGMEIDKLYPSVSILLVELNKYLDGWVKKEVE